MMMIIIIINITDKVSEQQDGDVRDTSMTILNDGSECENLINLILMNGG